MYERFFQLTNAPFSLVSDPECIHATPVFKDVMRNLVYGVLERRGCLVLTAEPGLGKTTSLRALSQLLIESNAQSSTILTPTITSSEFLELLMLNFGIQDVPASKARRLKILEDFLARRDASDKVSALIVDEAHKLSDDVLEEIRLLSNFEAGNRKLLQIVLAGQNELNDRLSSPELWQFKQRIATRLTLRRLDREDVADYVRFRWSEVGATSPFPFSSPALDAVAAWSGGIPRMINNICHNALLVAFSEATRTVDIDLVREACLDLDVPTPAVTFSTPLRIPPTPLVEARPPAEPAAPTIIEPAAPTIIEPAAPGPDEPKSSLFKRWRRADSRSGQLGKSRTSILALDEPAE